MDWKNRSETFLQMAKKEVKLFSIRKILSRLFEKVEDGASSCKRRAFPKGEKEADFFIDKNRATIDLK